MNPRKFYLIVDNWGNVIDYRDERWKPSDVSPYTVLYWTGTVFVKWDQHWDDRWN